MLQMFGLLNLKLGAEGEVPWAKCSSLRRRYCLLRRADMAIATFDTEAALHLAISLRESNAPSYPVAGANSSIDLTRVHRVRPSLDPTAPLAAFEILLHSPDTLIVVEPPSFQEADAWHAQLNTLLPARCYKQPAVGSLLWEALQASPSEPSTWELHPLSKLSAGQEVACAFLTLSNYGNMAGGHVAALLLLEAVDVEGAGYRLRLAQHEGYFWTEVTDAKPHHPQ